MLSTQNLTIGYGTRAVQSNLTLTATSGRLTALCGQNGAGKSTLLRTLCGLQPALSGSVTIDGTPLERLSLAQRAKKMALVLTDKIEERQMSVYDLVATGRVPYTGWLGQLSNNDRNIVEQALLDVALTHKANSLLGDLSDGERQRAVVAKALAQQTDIVLLDEPTAHLDLPNRIAVMTMLHRLAADTNKTFVMSTHELDLAFQTADTVWLMTDGVIAAPPEDLILQHRLQGAFENESFTFHPLDGHCEVTHPLDNHKPSICVQGDTIQANWLRRALNREGYTLTNENAQHTIIATEQFLVDNKQTAATIEEVLNYLQ
ncbi:MAG: ABC transporter ATP-binding protein [Paludibacteraceae bacterium]|nr:ABC transporter ATP-binding protein [Paludibacteraceae bacterium]